MSNFRDVGEAEVKLSSATGGDMFDDVNLLNLTFVPTMNVPDSLSMKLSRYLTRPRLGAFQMSAQQARLGIMSCVTLGLLR